MNTDEILELIESAKPEVAEPSLATQAAMEIAIQRYENNIIRGLISRIAQQVSKEADE